MMSAKTWAELVRRARDIADQPSGADLTRAQMYGFSAQAQARSLHEQQLAALYGVPVDQLRAVEQATLQQGYALQQGDYFGIQQLDQQGIVATQWIPSRTEDSRPAAVAGGSDREAEQGSDSPCSPPAPLRSTCACGQEMVTPRSIPRIRGGQLVGDDACSDCYSAYVKGAYLSTEPLDARIAAARKVEADPTDAHGAWAWPSAEDESW